MGQRKISTRSTCFLSVLQYIIYIYWTWKVQSNGAEKQANLIISLRQKRFFSVHILAPGSNHAKSETLQLPNSLTLVQGLCISQWSSGLSSNYDWRDKMLVVLFPPKSSLDSVSLSLAYLKDWQHVATDTFKQQILGSILQGVPKNAPLYYS